MSALAIRPWYVGHYGPTPPSLGLLSHGPNRNVNDHYGPIEEDPMWQQWDQPIPRSFYNPPPTIEATPETGPSAPLIPTGNLPEAVSLSASDSAPATDSATAIITGSLYDHGYATDVDGPLPSPLTAMTTGGGIDAGVTGGALAIPNAVPESTSYVLMAVRGDNQYVDADVASAGPPWTDGNQHFVVPLRWTDINNHTEARVVLTPTGYSIEVWDFVGGVDTRIDFTQLTTHTIRPTLTHIHAEAAGTTVIVRADFSDPDIGSVALAVTTGVASGPEAGIAVNYGQRFSHLTIQGGGAPQPPPPPPPPPPSAFTDDFARSDRDLNGDNGWRTDLGAAAIQGNTVVSTAVSPGPSPSGYSACLVTRQTGLVGTASVTHDTDSWLVIACSADASDFVIVRGNSAYRCHGGTSTTLTTTLTGGLAAGNVTAVVTDNGDGTFHADCFKGGVSIGAFNGPIPPGGSLRSGFYTEVTPQGMDDFSFGP